MEGGRSKRSDTARRTEASAAEHRSTRRRWVLAVLVVILLVFVCRVVSTYYVFTNVIDAPWHISAGLEYLRTGNYDYEPQHPPLARLALAALPYWPEDLRLGDFDRPWSGDWLDRELDFYWYTLALARFGNLVFAIPLLLVVFVWSRDLFGPMGGLAAVLAASCSPNLLAHSGIAALDIGNAATVFVAAYFLWRWSEEPGWRYCLLAALAVSAAVTTKFSALVFLPPIAAGYYLMGKRVRPRSTPSDRASFGIVFVLAVVMVCWAVYSFDFGRVPERAADETAVAATLGSMTLSAPQLWRGILDVVEHQERGHYGYLMGEVSEYGWWYYFPIAVALKTTPALLVLAALGIVLTLRRSERPLAGPALVLAWPIVVILAVGMISNLNIGVRHVLSIYPFLTVLAAAAFAGERSLTFRTRITIPALLLLGLHVADSFAVHPDYLAYFTPAVRGNEKEYLVDSNLDWGQDLGRLAKFVRENRIPAILLAYEGDEHAAKFGIRNSLLPPNHPDCCWIAAGANRLKGIGPNLSMLDKREPFAKVGKSIWVYKLTGDEIYSIK